MKKKLPILITFGLLILFVSIVGFAYADVPIDQDHFPDPFFRKEVKNAFDVDKNDILSDEELSSVTWITIYYKSISSFSGIEYFSELTELECWNNQLTSLDLSNNTKLLKVNCGFNNLTSINIQNCSNLKELWCNNNKLTSIDVSSCPALESLGCSNNSLVSIDVSHNPALKDLGCSYNPLVSIDLSNNPALESFGCSNNSLVSIDLSHNPALKSLGIYKCNLNEIDVSCCPLLTSLDLSENKISKIDISHNSLLESVHLEKNNLLSVVDVSNCEYLCALVKLGERKIDFWDEFFYWGDHNLSVNRCVKVVAGDTISYGTHYFDDGDEYHPRVEPTYTRTGVEAYWECNKCHKLFSDDRGENEISEPIIIPTIPWETEVTYNGQIFKLDNNKKTATFIKAEDKNSKILTIHDVIKANGGIKYKVTAIAKNACKKMKKLTTITIGKNVVKIGANAFNGCKKLGVVNIQTTKLTKAGIKGGFKGVKAYFYVPKKKLKKYMKWFINDGKANKKSVFIVIN